MEAAVRYVKSNFFAGQQGEPITQVEPALSRWVQEIAGRREHGTTGRRPVEVFEQHERAALHPLPALAYEPVLWKQATVHCDCHVIFDKRLYSVPWRRMGQGVWLRITPSMVAIYAEEERVATHSRRGPGYRSTREEHLPEGRSELRHRSRTYWQERADKLGEDVRHFIREVFDADDVLSQLRAVQAMVTHLETFPGERANAACRRARYYGNYSYAELKAILRQALDLEPLPSEATTTSPTALPPNPRFARNISELFLSHGGSA